MLGEPTNDVDTEMLTAMEDVLDSWPGTLIVVSHDRYLLERLTDHQYALFGGRLRHLPGGVDQYLQLSKTAGSQASPGHGEAGGPDDGEAGGIDGGAGGTDDGTDTSPATAAVSAAQQRAARKELAATERKLNRIAEQIAAVHQRLADHDQSDYTGLAELSSELQRLQQRNDDLEHQWLELSEVVG